MNVQFKVPTHYTVRSVWFLMKSSFSILWSNTSFGSFMLKRTPISRKRLKPVKSLWKFVAKRNWDGNPSLLLLGGAVVIEIYLESRSSAWDDPGSGNLPPEPPPPPPPKKKRLIAPNVTTGETHFLTFCSSCVFSRPLFWPQKFGPLPRPSRPPFPPLIPWVRPLVLAVGHGARSELESSLSGGNWFFSENLEATGTKLFDQTEEDIEGGGWRRFRWHLR